MKVRLDPADDGGCGWYRMTAPGRALQAAGYDVAVSPAPRLDPATREPVAMPAEAALHVLTHHLADGEHVAGLVDRPDCDVLVIQRPLRRTMAEVIPLLQAAGVAVVVEIDDDFHAVDRQNVAWPAAHSEWFHESHLKALVETQDGGYDRTPIVEDQQMTTLDGQRWHRLLHHRRAAGKGWLARCCALADHVIVTTPALAARYGAHGRVSVVPNQVPAAYLDMTPVQPWWGRSDHLAVGWTGAVTTHAGDLEVLGDVLVDYPGPFAVVGSGNGVADRTGRKPRACGWKRLHDYPRWAGAPDIGLVPLALTPFNQAKSTLKGLEYAALGRPFIASPTDPYLELKGEGVGLIAASPDAWRVALDALCEGDNAKRWGERWRDVVAERHTIEGTIDRWWGAYRAAHQHRQRSRT